MEKRPYSSNRPERSGRPDRSGRPNRSYRPRRSRPDSKVDNLIKKIKTQLTDSLDPVSLDNLNSFERKIIHRHFDHNPNYATRTYRHGEDYELRVYPVGNLRKFAHEKADEAITKGEKVILPHMNDYERFVIHDALKDNEAIKSSSFGEGDERHIELEPEMFGRGLKRIMKKIKLL